MRHSVNLINVTIITKWKGSRKKERQIMMTQPEIYSITGTLIYIC